MSSAPQAEDGEYTGRDEVAAIHDMLAEKLAPPSYYGRNLDALYDILTDMTEVTEIRIDRPWRARPVDRYVDRVLRTISDAAEENGDIRLVEAAYETSGRNMA
ncbi:barstar family protein [Lachnoclostridium sp. Marseille-P6806]|uniref:barstar family protein n=1 Tax=Lachnoclostridium sp. Marseille-P6806 TaxID=2364793 RepID=UPI0024150FB2|nr:barstar family protein [Lachnoclostridium sp. Marseille-P6806]